MKIAFITNVPSSVARTRLREEAERRNHSFTMMTWRNVDFTPRFAEKIAKQFNDYDVVHFAGGLGKFATREVQIVLERKGIFCPNSYTRRSFNSDHKVFQAVQFVNAGINIPKSIRATKPDFDSLEIRLGWPMIVKEPDSSQGKGVRILKSRFDSDSLTPKQEYLFQEFIDYIGDYRAHIAGDKAYCAYRRVATLGEFRANVSLGGRMEKINNKRLIERIYKLAINAAKAVGIEYGAVDILEGKDGKLYVLETNSDPGYKNVEEVTGESFASIILDYYESKSR